MEIKKYNVGKIEYTFVCEYWETSNAWGHRATLFRNDREMETNKERYYNRTWESFRFQMAMLGAINKEILKNENIELNNYRYKNNVKRLSAELKEKIFEDSEILQELKELKNLVKIG